MGSIAVPRLFEPLRSRCWSHSSCFLLCFLTFTFLPLFSQNGYGNTEDVGDGTNEVAIVGFVNLGESGRIPQDLALGTDTTSELGGTKIGPSWFTSILSNVAAGHLYRPLRSLTIT